MISLWQTRLSSPNSRIPASISPSKTSPKLAGTSALLKKWVEEVLAHGFAYGTGGTALQGKDFFISSTTGGPEESYSHEGPQNHPISEFFFNFDQLATFTGMKKHEPIITYGCMYVPGLSTEEDKQKIVDNCKASAQKLIEELKKI